MVVTGKTKIYGVLADPVEHVKTPEVYNAYFADRGVDVTVVPLHVKPRDLAAAMAMFRAWENLVGLAVTIPHKSAVFEHLDGLTADAELFGAVNVIKRSVDGRLVGAQFDGLGFLGALADAGFVPQGKRALIIGAGGTARALAFSLAQCHPSKIALYNRTPERAEYILDELRENFPDRRCSRLSEPDPTAFDLVVNATSCGLGTDELPPIEIDGLAPGTTVADVVMEPSTTAFLRGASERGCQIVRGRSMLDAQLLRTMDFLGILASDAHRS